MADALPRTPEEWVRLAMRESATERPDQFMHPSAYIHALAIRLNARKSADVRTAALWASAYASRYANPALINVHEAMVDIAAEHPAP